MGSERQPHLTAMASPCQERLEVLRYMADIVAELQEIATRQGCVTLAGLLALAHTEAEQRASDRQS